ncbi:MAG: class I SAM-dependent methyltransferase [Thermodesulfobacteriota bacterium]
MNFGIFSFLKELAKNPARTGSIAPSCDELCDLITDQAELNNIHTVIEFGPGTGVFTEKIMDKISVDTTFFALELNPVFIEVTKKRCPGVIIYNDSAENSKKYLEMNGKSCCDCIISGLPWTAFGPALQDRLLETIWDILSPKGRFLTFSYSHSLLFPTARRFRKRLKNIFPEVTESKTVWANFPPAFVYCAKK